MADLFMHTDWRGSKMLISIIISILLSQTNLISWPVNNHFPYRGYGDYNGIAEFHTGLDFRARPIEEVSVPSPGQEHYVVEVYDQAGIDNVIVVLSPGPNAADIGWAYEHMDYSLHPADLPQDGDVLPSSQTTLTTCTPANGDEPQHVHLARNDEWKWNPLSEGESFLVQNNPYNLFLDLDIGISIYDYPEFTSVENYAGGETGIVFMQDESSNALSRDDIFGRVDMLVSLVNRFWFVEPEDQDYCSVGAIRYRILEWNDYEEQFEPTYECDWRIVFDMLGFLPGALDDIQPLSDEFLRIYIWTPSKYDNVQCITNCGTLNNVTNCLDNVWVNLYDRALDYAEGQYCRGAWDTRIGDQIRADCNRAAWFKDGRYAIEVEAISQGSRFSLVDTLPVTSFSDNLDDRGNTSEIIVDNYWPFISGLWLYDINEEEYNMLWSAICYFSNYNDPDPIPGPDRYWSYIGELYLPTSYDSKLGVVVTTSEDVEFSETGISLHLETEVGDTKTWEALVTFSLDEWNRQLFVPGLDEDFALYTSGIAPVSWPEEYMGRIVATLVIDDNELAVDLAGNPLDMEPLTWMSPNDSITGDPDQAELEDIPFEVSHEWGTAENYYPVYGDGWGWIGPDAWIQGYAEDRVVDVFIDQPKYQFDGSVIGTTWIGPDAWIQGYAEDRVVDVFIDQPKHPYDRFMGDCPWLCGFWVLRNDDTGSAIFGYAGTVGAYTVDCFGDITSSFDVLSGEEVKPVQAGATACDGKVGWIAFANNRPHSISWIRYTDLYVAACNTENGEHELFYIDTGISWYFWPIERDTRGQGWSRIIPTGINDNGDLTFDAHVAEEYGVPWVVTEYTILCPWSFTEDCSSSENDNSCTIEEIEVNKLIIEHPFPNPASGSVTVNFLLSCSASMKIAIYDLSGRIVYEYAQDDYPAGSHSVQWLLASNSGLRVPSGIYLVHFESTDFVETQRLVIID